MTTLLHAASRTPQEALGPLALDLLNAIAAHIAVVDAHGTIVAVNRAWRRFALANGGSEDACGVGASYLAACERGIGHEGGEASRRMRDGVLALLADGPGEPFSLEYPCHADGEKRWFAVEATRFVHDGNPYVALVHENITERKLAQEALREAESALQDALGREQRMARTDELTGLRNRRHFFELAEPLFAAARRYASPLCVAMFDLDHFKRVNDRYGHHAGDEVLRAVAGISAAQTRAADVLARYGGEELVLALPGTSGRDALAAAEKIRRAIEAATMPGGLRVTVSAGVAEWRGEPTLDALIRRADAALYRAKASGRNRSVLF
jgi:diguanylate cyclase (GGDEF)-like protein